MASVPSALAAAARASSSCSCSSSAAGSAAAARRAARSAGGGPSLLPSGGGARRPQHPSFPRRRVLTGKGMGAEARLRNVLEEFRQVHFTQEVPTRFKKEVARAAAAAAGCAGAGGAAPKYDPNLAVSAAGLERIVRNVGGTPRQLSPCELRAVVSLHGDAASGTISAGRLVQVL